MFNISAVEVQDDFAPLPAGWYSSFVDRAEWKTSKAGVEYLNAAFKIFGENYANRIVFNTYNLHHEKEQVRNIAMGDLKKMFTASGLTEDQMNFATKEELVAAILKVRCRVKLSIRKSDEYGDSNEIKGYQELDEKSSMPLPVSVDSIPF